MDTGHRRKKNSKLYISETIILTNNYYHHQTYKHCKLSMVIGKSFIERLPMIDIQNKRNLSYRLSISNANDIFVPLYTKQIESSLINATFYTIFLIFNFIVWHDSNSFANLRSRATQWLGDQHSSGPIDEVAGTFFLEFFTLH